MTLLTIRICMSILELAMIIVASFVVVYVVKKISQWIKKTM